MGNVDSFLKSLLTFDKDNVPGKGAGGWVVGWGAGPPTLLCFIHYKFRSEETHKKESVAARVFSRHRAGSVCPCPSS